jgi:NitT/TauT family transport system ATP-binding protein
VPDVDLSEVTVRFASRRVRTTALEEVSLRVPRGEFVTIVGPSGCGKSTLLKVIAGLVRPASGAVSLLDRPVTGPRDDIGFVFQRAALLD